MILFLHMNSHMNLIYLIQKTGEMIMLLHQGKCGSCWAFSAVGNLESQNMIVNNEEIILSEQQLVDCDKKDNGCRGGLIEYALDYLINAGG